MYEPLSSDEESLFVLYYWCVWRCVCFWACLSHNGESQVARGCSTQACSKAGIEWPFITAKWLQANQLTLRLDPLHLNVVNDKEGRFYHMRPFDWLLIHPRPQKKAPNLISAFLSRSWWNDVVAPSIQWTGSKMFHSGFKCDRCTTLKLCKHGYIEDVNVWMILKSPVNVVEVQSPALYYHAVHIFHAFL